MEIKLQNDELILQKLCKLKCKQGCQNPANYIVFQMGLFCTTCLAKLQDLPQDQFTTLQNLSKIIADLVDNYKKSTKTGSNLLVLKAEAQQNNKTIKNMRDGLIIDIKSINSKASNKLINIQNHCRNQTRNEPLQNFFQPDLTTSMLLNETELFLKNLNNLVAVKDNGEIKYYFQQSQKSPQLAKNEALKKISHINNTIINSHNKMKEAMNRFRQAKKQ